MRFKPSYWVTRCLPSSATNKLRCQSGSDQRTLCSFGSSTRVPAFGSEMARMRPLGLVTVTLLGGGRGVSPLMTLTAIAMLTKNRSARIDLTTIRRNFVSSISAFIEGTIPVKGMHGFILYEGLPAVASLNISNKSASGDHIAKSDCLGRCVLQFA